MLHPNLDFVSTDALHLPFDDNSFSLCVYTILFASSFICSEWIERNARVCKPGGILFAQEPDINTIISYPESWAYQKHKEYLNLFAADALFGRKLIPYFRKLQLQNITHYVGL